MFFTSESDPSNNEHFGVNPAHADSVFMIVTLSWIVTFAGLLGITLIDRPLWWVAVLMWVSQLLSAVVIQILHLWYMRASPPWVQKQKDRFGAIQEQAKPLRNDTVGNALKEQPLLESAQIAAAFEHSFQRIGIRTEDYRQDIEEAINTLYLRDADQQAFSSCLHRLLQAAKQNWAGLAVFSPREREILELLLQNISYKEMSSRLHVSISTIKTHIYHIFQKLGASNREEAVYLIRERGWFSVNECTLPVMNKCGKPAQEVAKAN